MKDETALTAAVNSIWMTECVWVELELAVTLGVYTCTYELRVRHPVCCVHRLCRATSRGRLLSSKIPKLDTYQHHNLCDQASSKHFEYE